MIEMLTWMQRFAAGTEPASQRNLPDGYVWHRETVRRAESAFRAAWSRWQLAPGISVPAAVDDAWRQLRATWLYLQEVDHRARMAEVCVPLEQDTGRALALLAPLARQEAERGR